MIVHWLGNGASNTGAVMILSAADWRNNSHRLIDPSGGAGGGPSEPPAGRAGALAARR